MDITVSRRIITERWAAVPCILLYLKPEDPKILQLHQAITRQALSSDQGNQPSKSKLNPACLAAATAQRNCARRNHSVMGSISPLFHREIKTIRA